MRQIYDQRRQFIVPALREAGFAIGYEPDGAYYVLLNIKRYSNNSMEFGKPYSAWAALPDPWY